MQITEFLAQLEHELATRLAGLDIKAHPSSHTAGRLTREWTVQFVAREAAKHPEFFNLAALLRNVTHADVFGPDAE